jgi:hypothetical protein
MTCIITHAEHLATWKSWQDDCADCGFGMQDPDQCDRGHPDDEVTFCGACGHDKVYNALAIGELSAICDKADAEGVDTHGWSIAETIRAFPLTDAERGEVARKRREAQAAARAKWTSEDWSRFHQNVARTEARLRKLDEAPECPACGELILTDVHECEPSEVLA